MPSVVVTPPSGLLDAVARAAAAAITGYTEFWMPDVGWWENTGVVAPFCQSQVMRKGALWYAFGGNTNTASSQTSSSTIWTAPADDTGTVPTFTASGSTMPSAVIGGRVALIDDTYYMFGAQDGKVAIWSAPYATPLVWADTGQTHGVVRYSAPLVVGGGKIVIVHGYDGVSAGYQTCRYTSTATPTSGWANTNPSVTGRWESGACYVQPHFIFLGGYQPSAASQLVFLGHESSFSTLLPSNGVLSAGFDKMPEILDLGTELCLFGGANSQTVMTQPPNRPIATWMSLGAQLTAAQQYTQGGAWIGLDGRAYYIQTSNRTICRSARKKVYVPNAAIVSRTDPYQAMPGVLANGAPAVVSRHRLMGIPPWLTNKTVQF